jgi:TonB family protein
MNNILIYVLQSGFTLSVLYLFYWLFLRRDTFFGLNRIFLIFSLAVSFIFPLLNISFSSGREHTYMVFLEPVIIQAENVKTSIISSLSFTDLITVAYLLGALVVFILFLYKLVQMAFLISKYGITKKYGMKVVYLPKGFTPFSFFNIVFISNEVSEHHQLKEILTHEKIHIQQKHSADIILLELVTVFQWFNPFVWLYRKSIKNLHEFQADQGVINTGYNKQEYQQLLLNQTFGMELNTLSNNFNSTLIKTRFKMMTKTKTKKSALLKMVFIIPAAVALALLFSISVADRVSAQSDKEVTKVENAQEPVKKVQKEEEIFTVVEVMPKFPGGDEARINYMVNNIKYPEDARKSGKSGTVFVTYVVEKDGSITDVQILRGFYKSCDEEALRVVKAMPNWEPGKQDGKPVRVKYNIPIYFKLDSSAKKGEKEIKDPPPPPPPKEK